MTLPLVILALLCVFVLYSFNPVSPDEGWFYHLVQPPGQAALGSAVMHAGPGEADDPSHSYALILSVLLAALGIITAYRTYLTKRISADTWASMYPRLYTGMLNKWYIDEYIAQPS